METNIVFINCHSMSYIIDSVKKEYNDALIEFKMVDSMSPLKSAKALSIYENNVIIASGITARELLSSKELLTPVVSIVPDAFDIMMAIKEGGLTNKKIRIIILEIYSQYILEINALLKEPVEISIVDNHHQCESLIDTIVDIDNTIVVGSNYTCNYAKKRGLITFNIYRENAIRTAINNALKIGSSKTNLFANRQMLDMLLDESRKGVIYVDSNNIVRKVNATTLSIFNTLRELVEYKPLKSTPIYKSISDCLHNAAPDEVCVVTINKEEFLVTWRPLVDESNQEEGIIISLQYAKRVQKDEHVYRKNATKKVFMAKYTFNDIRGCSSAIQKVKETAEKYASTNSTILLQGESGTGKELFAQSIHNASKRSSSQFVSANFTSIPLSLIESELFGYEGGAFTGAKKEGKMGLFELAHGGTLFLDEIGDIPKEMQTQLLRVLEEKEVLRVGGEYLRNVDVRIVAATNKSLIELVDKNLFRRDLYYRLNVLAIVVPPLRERIPDIPSIAADILTKMRADINDKLINMISNSPALFNYSWPGNIRELRNIIERFSALYSVGQDYDALFYSLLNIDKDFKSEPPLITLDENPYRNSTSNLTDDNLEFLMRKHGGNRSAIANELGISRTTLWRKMKDKGLI